MRLESALLKINKMLNETPKCFDCSCQIYEKYGKVKNNKSLTVNGTPVILRNPNLEIRVHSGDVVFFCHNCFANLGLERMGLLERFAFVKKKFSENNIEANKQDVWMKFKKTGGCYGMGKRR